MRLDVAVDDAGVDGSPPARTAGRRPGDRADRLAAARRCARLAPGTYSITRYGGSRRGRSRRSSTRFGCTSEAATKASRRKRAMKSGSVGEDLGQELDGHGRARRGSSASHTDAIPPEPIALAQLVTLPEEARVVARRVVRAPIVAPYPARRGIRTEQAPGRWTRTIGVRGDVPTARPRRRGRDRVEGRGTTSASRSRCATRWCATCSSPCSPRATS